MRAVFEETTMIEKRVGRVRWGRFQEDKSDGELGERISTIFEVLYLFVSVFFWFVVVAAFCGSFFVLTFPTRDTNFIPDWNFDTLSSKAFR